MYTPPDRSLKPLDIKDHADLMDAFEQLVKAITDSISDHRRDEITYLKAEIAHFLRIESPHSGVAVCGDNDAFRNSGGERGARLP